MFAEVDGLKIYYQAAGTGDPIVLLHGWGGRVESFKPVFDSFAKSFKVYALDFPGFGRSQLSPVDWGVRDYASFVAKFLAEIGVPKASLIAHSFGGRVAIALAALYPEMVERLVLVNSAGIRPRRTAKYYLRVAIVKAARRLFPLFGKGGQRWLEAVRHAFGSEDYRRAGPLRGTFVKVVNEDVRGLLPKIQAPTLIVWGDRDEIIRLSSMKLMERGIKNASLVILEGAGHFSYLDRLPQFCLIVARFLEGRKA